MTWHGFLDESRRGSTYLVAVVSVRPRDLDAVRSALRRMVKPGQRRVHCKKESGSRRGELLALLHGLGIRARIWVCEHSNDQLARQVCLTAVARHMVKVRGARLALESCQHQDVLDRRTLAAVAGWGGFNYDHFAPGEDPILWASDTIAWCYGAGGEWRRRVSDLVEEVVRLDKP
jgi:hypothetical protein